MKKYANNRTEDVPRVVKTAPDPWNMLSGRSVRHDTAC